MELDTHSQCLGQYTNALELDPTNYPTFCPLLWALLLWSWGCLRVLPSITKTYGLHCSSLNLLRSVLYSEKKLSMFPTYEEYLYVVYIPDIFFSILYSLLTDWKRRIVRHIYSVCYFELKVWRASNLKRHIIKEKKRSALGSQLNKRKHIFSEARYRNWDETID